MSIWTYDTFNLLPPRTSEEWQQLCKYQVLDPDGWDRKNFDYSWYQEVITAEEFELRLMSSTIQQVQP